MNNEKNPIEIGRARRERLIRLSRKMKRFISL